MKPIFKDQTILYICWINTHKSQKWAKCARLETTKTPRKCRSTQCISAVREWPVSIILPKIDLSSVQQSFGPYSRRWSSTSENPFYFFWAANLLGLGSSSPICAIHRYQSHGPAIRFSKNVYWRTILSSRHTESVGCAPTPSQYFTRDLSIEISLKDFATFASSSDKLVGFWGRGL